MRKSVLLMSLMVIAGLPLRAAEYFVSTRGNDARDGLSRDKAFLTVQKGVDALQPGDTLTILPGEYVEHVRRDNLGSPDQDTLIRADISGTVLLRGDVPAPKFTRVEGYRFVYRTDMDQDAQAVNELDTLAILEKMMDIPALEFIPGAFYYDGEHKKLYISTSDLQAPDRHDYTVSVNPRSGLYLDQPVRVILEGLAATGFHRAAHNGFKFDSDYIWGLVLAKPDGCTVRDCTTFLNSGGICLVSGSNNVVEGCVSFANYSKYAVEGGNIFRVKGQNDVIRRCTASRSKQAGFRYYLEFTGPVRFEHNLAWDNLAGDYWIKGEGSDDFGSAIDCVGLGQVFNVKNITNCVLGGKNNYRWGMTNTADNVFLKNEPALDFDREFANPDNLDFRLQATSRFRGTGPSGTDRGAFPYATNIFYAAVDGNDQADGQSVSRAWKTLARAFRSLRPGDTLYLTGGVYDADAGLTAGQADGEKVFIRGRGPEPVTLQGNFRITQSAGIAFDRLMFHAPLVVQNSRRLSFSNCVFAGLDAEAVQDLEITHGRFSAPLQLKQCADVFLSGNLHAFPVRLEQSLIRYSDYNGYPSADACWVVDGVSRSFAELQKEHGRYARVMPSVPQAMDAAPPEFLAGGPLGTPLGPFREFRKTPIRYAGPFLHSTSPTTANIEWWSSHPSLCTVVWGDTSACSYTNAFKVHGFAGYSLTGLQPATTYHVRLQSIVSDPGTDPLGLLEDVAPTQAPLVFQTDAADAVPRRLYVAPDGDDRNSGLSWERAWRTVMAAADRVRAGDTVFIAGGTYKEMVRVRVTGGANAPVTFKSLPGEKVVLDGDGRTLTGAFIANNKHHLRFDGLYFVGFNNADHDSPLSQNGVFLFSRCSDVELTRCFHDGRGSGYAPVFLRARDCADLLMKNCVVMNGFCGLHTIGCPGLRLEHNVFLRNLITAVIPVNQPDQKMYFRKNIFTDGIPDKVLACVLEVGSVESLAEEDNCYYLRVPDTEKKLFRFYGGESYWRCARLYGWPTHFVTPPVFTDLTHLNLQEYQAQFGDTGSLVANPLFQGALAMETEGKDGKPLFMADRLVGKKDLDFPDLFATNPEMVRKGIGLIPEDFKDFHFMPSDQPSARP